MKILMVNKYFFIKGGAEISFFATADLLRNHGHKISYFSMSDSRNFTSEYDKYFVSNIDFNDNSSNIIKSSLRILYSFESKMKISKLLDDEKPDLVHLNNIYHQISPSIIHEIKKRNIPIVMSLRDYKLVCGAYCMVVRGKICEACKEGRYFKCLVNKCVKDSYLKSLLNTVEMYLHHNIFNIYDLVDVFISPSRFLKHKVEEMGFKGKIMFIPNFVNLEDYRPQYESTERSIVYFGRLSKEKGLFTLIKAMKNLKVNLKIIGEGPLKTGLDLKVKELGLKNVQFLGYKKAEELKKEIKKSMFVILPSECNENNPRSIIEGFALGKPAIGSRIGGIPELVKDNETGLTFEPGDSNDLFAKIEFLLDNPNLIVQMGMNSRKFIECELNSEIHYSKLIKIYEELVTKNEKNN